MLTPDQLLFLAWGYHAPRYHQLRKKENFQAPRGFWPDVARTAIEWSRLNLTEAEAEHRIQQALTNMNPDLPEPEVGLSSLKMQRPRKGSKLALSLDDLLG